MKRAVPWSILVFALSIPLTFSGCDRMITSRHAQWIKDAEAKSGQGDFMRAINLYEAALDDTPQCAEVHYQLALLYDDKLKDPLNALHHFKRYLVLSPNGPRANEIRASIKRDEVDLLTSLSGDAILTRTEAARLRNENLDLRKQLEERSGNPRGFTDRIASDKTANSPTPVNASRSYTVRPGDTLASISRKFYKTSKRSRDIRDANEKKIDDPDNLKAGTKLTIPEND